MRRFIQATGKASGYAWSANCGWISLSNTVAYVQTDTLARLSATPARSASAHSLSPGSSPAVATLLASAGFGRKALWLAGLVLVLAAGTVVLLLLRRPRTGPSASLITRSLDRDDKSTDPG